MTTKHPTKKLTLKKDGDKKVNVQKIVNDDSEDEEQREMITNEVKTSIDKSFGITELKFKNIDNEYTKEDYLNDFVVEKEYDLSQIKDFFNSEEIYIIPKTEFDQILRSITQYIKVRYYSRRYKKCGFTPMKAPPIIIKPKLKD